MVIFQFFPRGFMQGLFMSSDTYSYKKIYINHFCVKPYYLDLYFETIPFAPPEVSVAIFVRTTGRDRVVGEARYRGRH